ncbi:hypothetical protein EJ05DRAFT_520604, partial [Pseudovirgaria hyperparasitica]
MLNSQAHFASVALTYVNCSPAPLSVYALANIIFIGSTASKFGETLYSYDAASKSGVMYG